MSRDRAEVARSGAGPSEILAPRSSITAVRGAIVVLALIAIAVAALAPGAAARNPTGELERAGAWPFGLSRAVDLDPARSIVFLGSGGAILALDVSDPTDPQLISDTMRTTGLVLDLFYDASDAMLYAACDVGGLEIWDVADPAAPVHMSTTEVLYFDVETPVSNVDVTGNFAVVECGFGYVHTLDVSDPAHPTQVAFNGQMGNPAADIYVDPSGTIHSTGAQYYLRLTINPDGTLNSAGIHDFTPYGASDVWGDDEVAYVEFQGALYILDLLLPGFPAWSVTNVNGINDFAVDQDHAFIVNDDGLQIWDVAVPNNPVFVASLIGIPSAGQRIVVHGSYAYVANRQDGLSVIDISSLSDPQEVGTYDVYSVTWATELDGSYAYLAHSDDGLLVLDLNDIERPEVVGQVDAEAEARDVDVAGDYAYLANSFDGLRIVDISDPTAPFQVALLDTYRSWRVDVQGDVAYMVEPIPNQPYVVHTIDVSDPLHPSELGSVTMPEIVWELTAVGDYVYVAGGDSGIRILDVSDPANPVQANVVFLPDVLDVDVQDGRLYVVSSDPFDGGVFVFDLTDPLLPILEGSYGELGFVPYHLDVEGEFAYVVDPDELFLLDVSSPQSPQVLDSHEVPGFIMTEVTARSGLAYVSAGDAGVQILRNGLVTGVGGDGATAPGVSGLTLGPNVPNPFVPATTIRFTLPAASRAALDIYDARGRLVRRLLDGARSAGTHAVRWDGTDDQGREVASGVYFYRLDAGQQVLTRKMLRTH
jgi:hypothetical protein